MRLFLAGFFLIPFAVCAQTYPTLFNKISKTQGNLNVALDVGAQFGIMSAAIGDLDDDGVTDIAVGAVNQGGFAVGSVYILFLNSSGTVKSKAVIQNSEAGDADSFGSSVCGLGDMDGDGVEDIAIGANYDGDGGTQWGALWIVFLNTNGTVKSKQKISALSGNLNEPLNTMAEFGTGATNLGDIDHDGVADLAVGAYHYGGARWGCVFILFMNSNGTVKSHTIIANGTAGLVLDPDGNFGYALSKIGDLDGDGVPELAAGGHRNGAAGAAWIFFLNSAGTVKKFTKITPGVPNFVDPSASIFGVALTAINDYDGDSVPDMIAGGNDASLTGAIWYMMLKPDGTVKSSYKISGNTANTNLVLHSGDFFGGSLANLGDFNGDGIPEVLVGAFQDDDGGLNSGAVWISNFCRPPTNAGPDLTVCMGGSVTMNAKAPTSGSGSWSVLQGSGTFSNIQDPKAIVIQLGPGTNSFVWTISIPGCGIGKDSVRVIVTSKPTAVIDMKDSVFTCAKSYDIKAVTPAVGTGLWTVVSGDATIADPKSAHTQVLMGMKPAKLAWSVSIAGCDPAVDYLDVVPIIFTGNDLPNVITPNGDGLNDFWKIKHIELVSNSIRMYDRWGLPVFEISDYKNTWSGGGLSAGAYYYYLIIPSCNLNIKGILNIID